MFDFEKFGSQSTSNPTKPEEQKKGSTFNFDSFGSAPETTTPTNLVAGGVNVSGTNQVPSEDTEPGFARKAFDLFTSSEQGFGESIGQAINTQLYAKEAEQNNARYMKAGNDMLALAKKTLDPIKKETYLNQSQKYFEQAGRGIQDIIGGDIKTTKQVLGEAAGTALDAVTMGTYGAAAKTAISGVKMAKPALEAIPTVISKLSSEGIKEAGKKVGIGAGVGYGYDVSFNLQNQEHTDGVSILTPGFATLIGAGLPSLGFAYGAVKEVVKGKPLETVVKAGMEKGVKPSVAGKQTLGKIDEYHQKAADAVKSIVNYKDNLKFVDPVTGDEIVGELPKTLEQFGAAIEQTKKAIFNEYDALAKATGKQGNVVTFDSLLPELEKAANDTVLNLKDPHAAAYAADMAEKFKQLQQLTPEQAQQYITQMNADLQSFYRNPTYGTSSKVGIDVLIVNNMRKALDAVIESATGKEYQKLKSMYGSLKAIEKDVNHRAVVDARKNNATLVDYSNIFTYGDIARGLISMDPATVVKGTLGKGLQMFYKWRNDPNVLIKEMFEKGEKAIKNNVPSKPPVEIKSNKGFIDTMFPQEGKESPSEVMKTILDKAKNMPAGMSVKDVSGGKAGYEGVKKNLDNYVYHQTSKENLASITEKGLQPNITPTSLRHSSTKVGVSFSPNEVGASSPSAGREGLMLRVNKGKLSDYKITSSPKAIPEGMTEKSVPPEFLEVKINGKWQPLLNNKAQGGVEKVPTAITPVYTPGPLTEAKKYKTKEEFVAAFDRYKGGENKGETKIPHTYLSLKDIYPGEHDNWFDVAKMEGSRERIDKMRAEFDPKKLDPILVRKYPKSNGFAVEDGHHRMQALIEASLMQGKDYTSKIPVYFDRDTLEKIWKVSNGDTSNETLSILKRELSGLATGKELSKTPTVVTPKEVYKTGPLTTKLLKKLEGRSTVSKTFISDLTNAPDLKQTEKDVIRQVLESEGDKVNVADFGKKVESELLPLKVSKTKAKYEGVSLSEDLRGEVKNYKEHVYESPVKTSAGNVHFSDSVKRKTLLTDAEASELSSLKHSEKFYLRRSQESYRKNDTRSAEKYNGYLKETRSKLRVLERKMYEDLTPEGYFGHTRVEDLPDNKTRRVIEVQSDLYQKGRLENEAVSDLAKKEFNNNKSLTYTEAQELALKNEEKLAIRNKELSKLQQYNNPTAHFRMVREEIKRAADDGVEKVQFPTGETGMKIEGLGQRDFWKVLDKNGKYLTHTGEGNSLRRGSNVYLGDDIPMKEGMQITRGINEDDWIITDVLGDGKFKAVPKSIYETYGTLKTKSEYAKEQLQGGVESFDISGKVDQNNPIYKFYEKELGRYLKNNFDAKLVTDKQGVSWMEVTVKPEHKGPVTAFGAASLGTILSSAAAGGVISGGVALANQKQKTVTVLNPRYYNEDGSKKEETPKEKEVVKTILAKQEDDVVQRLSQWTQGEASTYNPLDPRQTRKGTDGTGAYGRKVERGSIAFGNRYFQDELKAGKKIYIQVEGMEDVKTPYGPGVFRVDDTMNKRYNQKGKFNIDFHPEDFGKQRTEKGRFPVRFKIVRID